MQKILNRWLFVPWLFVAAQARADFSTYLESYFSLQGAEPANSSWNRSNRLLGIPAYQGTLDLRPEFKWTTQDHFKAIVRPRLLGFYNVTNKSNPNESVSYSEGQVNLTDAYVEGSLSDHWSYDMGLQVFQWGPAELLSPSNPIYHFRNDQRGAFYKEKGHVLVRFNWIQDNWSFIAISEPVSNNERAWQFSENFQAKSVFKLERQSPENRGSYFGLTAGNEDAQNTFWGEYGNWSFAEGWSWYFDARHPQNPRHYVVYTDSLGFQFLDRVNASGVFYSILDTGVRYEADWDWRLEYIYNSPGMDREKIRQAFQSTHRLSPYIFGNIAKFAAPGLELYGQQYLYFSVRLPDLGKSKKHNLAFRYLHSLQDDSGALQFDWDRALSDALVGYLEISSALGNADSEMNWSTKVSGFFGCKWIL